MDICKGSTMPIDTLLADAEKLANASYEEGDGTLNETVLHHMDSLNIQRNTTIEVSAIRNYHE